MYPNIAFIGKAGAGKDEAAKLLIEHFGYRRLAFAGEHEGGLRDVAVRIFGPEARNDRDVLQKLGAAVRRVDPDAWVNAALRTLRRANGGLFIVDDAPRDPEVGADARLRPVTVTDCRYPNEAVRLTGEGFVVVEVYAARDLRIDRLRANGKLGPQGWENHESETALDHYLPDHTVYNEGTKADLLSQLLRVLRAEQDRR